MIPTQELRGFLKKWRTALRERSTADRLYWEGQKAVADLKKTNYLRRMRLEERNPGGIPGGGLDHFIASRHVPRICEQLAVYKKHMRTIRSDIDSMQIRLEVLAEIRRRIDREATFSKHTDPDLSNDLRKISLRIGGAIFRTKARFEKRWIDTVPFFIRYRGHKTMFQARQIDSWFQVRLGLILRTDMPKNPAPKFKDERGPSLRTIARLVVLFLVCADLAEVEGNCVVLTHNGRRVTVDGVLQQLRDAKIEPPPAKLHRTRLGEQL